MQSKGMNLSASHWTAEEFAKAGLPLIVQCKTCYQTMAFPTATVDREGYCYCSECANED